MGCLLPTNMVRVLTGYKLPLRIPVSVPSNLSVQPSLSHKGTSFKKVLSCLLLLLKGIHEQFLLLGNSDIFQAPLRKVHTRSRTFLHETKMMCKITIMQAHVTKKKFNYATSSHSRKHVAIDFTICNQLK